MRYLVLFVVLFLFGACRYESERPREQGQYNAIENEQLSPTQILEANSNYWSDGFDFPIGKPDGKGYYNAQAFGLNSHLGDDWNAVTGGNSDLGDPIYVVANGLITEVKDYAGGWGKVVRVIHKMENGKLMESLYAHCQDFKTNEGDLVNRGDLIATIGNANGVYLAHLHLEIRNRIGLDIGGGYGDKSQGQINPTHFIKANRPNKK